MGEPGRAAGSLKALLVLGWDMRTWTRHLSLPFAPSPGLGIRLDVYDMVRVDSVVVGDPGCDVTCICVIEGEASHYSEGRLAALGFQEGGYP